MTINLRAGIAGLAMASALMAAPVVAQQQPPGPLPYATKDLKTVGAGDYTLDKDHAAVIAYVSHLGYSNSVFRFDKVEGSMTWNPADLKASSLKVTVHTGSVATNVANFAADVAGPTMLKAKDFPTATFVSTAFRRIDDTHGKVDGQFTFMGKTIPLTFDVSLVGAGKFYGQDRLGIHATASFDPQAFGLSEVFGHSTALVIDTEFSKGEMKF